MVYVATFTPGQWPLFLMGCPDEANKSVKVKLGLSEAENRRMKNEIASASIMIEREPLAPHTPYDITWQEWTKIREAQLASDPVEYVGEFTFEELKKNAKMITIKQNAKDDDDTAKWYIVLNKYFRKGLYTFYDCNVRLSLELPSDGPATQEEFEASFSKLLEDPCVKEDLSKLKKPAAASENCCLQ